MACLGASDDRPRVSLFLSVFTRLSEERFSPPCLQEPPHPFSHCPLSVEKTAFPFSFLFLKMNSPTNPSSTYPSEKKENDRDGLNSVCVDFFYRYTSVRKRCHLRQSILSFLYSAVSVCLQLVNGLVLTSWKCAHLVIFPFLHTHPEQGLGPRLGLVVHAWEGWNDGLVLWTYKLINRIKTSG